MEHSAFLQCFLNNWDGHNNYNTCTHIKVIGSKITSDILLQVQCSQIKTCIRLQNNIPATNKNVKQIHQVFYLTDQLRDVILLQPE